MPAFRNQWLVFERGTERWSCEEKNWKKISNAVEKRILADKNFGAKILKRTLEIGKKHYKNCYRAIDLGRAEKTNFKKLEKLWGKIFDSYSRMCTVGVYAVMSDLEHQRLSNRLKKIVGQRKNLKRSVGEYISILTKSSFISPCLELKKFLLQFFEKNKRASFAKKFLREPAYAILEFLRQNKPKTFKELTQIVEKYAWVEYGHLWPAMNLTALVGKIKNIFTDKKEQEILRDTCNFRKLLFLQNKFVKELRLTTKEKQYFQMARNFSAAKDYRTGLMFLTYFAMHLLMKKVSAQFGYSLQEWQTLSREEFSNFLKTKKLPSYKVLRERYNFSVAWVMAWDDVRIFTGARAKKFLAKNISKEIIKKNQEIIKGSVAWQGKVSGKVKIINRVEEMGKVRDGDILVAPQTLPALLPAMKKAAAFVTDIGGITSHAAIVAREMRKPCIIGTGNATRILRDGQMAEVDANEGVVKIIKK